MYKWYHKVGMLVLFLVVFFVFLNLFPIKKNINKSVEGTQWKFDNEECENLTVTIEGQYVNYFLNFIKDDYFQGMITLSSQPYTVQADSFMYPIQFMRDYYDMVTFADGIHMGNLVYGNGYAEEIENMGKIFQKEPLEQGVIVLNDSGGVISFPSQKREEAVALADEMLPDEVREVFTEIQYYYMGEPVSITDPDIIAAANTMLREFHGKNVQVEESVYGSTYIELVYPEQTIGIVMISRGEEDYIGIGDDLYLIEEDISLLRDMLKDIATGG